MKNALALILALAVVLSLGVAAFAGSSPEGSPAEAPKEYYYGPPLDTLKKDAGLLEAYDANDKKIGDIPAEDVTQVVVGDADKLEAADKETFLAAYEEAKAVESKAVKFFYWLQVKNLPEGCAYVKYPFTCSGENVQVTVNGNEMEVVSLGGDEYYAKLTEFGSVAILCDAE